MREFVLSDMDKWKAAFHRALRPVLAFYKRYFWVLFCSVFAILAAFSYLFVMEVDTNVSAVLCALAVALIAVLLGVLLRRCPKLYDRSLYSLLSAFVVYQFIFHVPASLPALSIALLVGTLLLFPHGFLFLPFMAAAGCWYSEYFAYCHITVVFLCVYIAGANKTEKERRFCYCTFCLSTVIASVLQIILYGGFQSFSGDFTPDTLISIAALFAALSTMICYYERPGNYKICIAVNASLIIWCILWPDLLALALAACIVFYHRFFEGFLRKAWSLLLQKTGPCLLCFAGILCIIRIGGFHLPRTHYAIYTYYLNYLDLGFVRRSLIGTVVYLLFGYKISWLNICLFIAVLCYIEAAICVYLTAKMVRSLHTDNALIMATFSTVLIVLIPSMLSPVLMGHMENHLSLILLLCLYCIHKGKKAVWLTIPLCAAGICIHTGFIFDCFPLVFLTVFFATILQPKQPEKYAFFLLFLLAVVTCGLFVYMTYFSYAFSMMPAEKGIQYLIDRSGNASTNTYARKILFYDVLNAAPTEHLDYAKDKLSVDIQLKNIIRMRFFIPHLFLYFAAFWISARQMDTAWKKWFMLLLPFGIITFLPLYLFETDHGRWNTMLVLWLCVGIIGIAVLQEKDRWYQNIPDKVSKLIAFIMVITSVNAGLFQVFS